MTRAARLAWTVWIASTGLSVSALVLVVLSRHSPAPVALLFRGSEATLSVSMTSVGLVIALKRPDHRIGWLFGAAGLVVSVLVFGEHYAVYSYLTLSDPLPGAVAAAWLQSWVGPGGYFTLFAFLLLLFPTGRLPSRRLLPVGWLVVVGGALVSVGLALRPGPVDVLTFIANPIGVSGRAGRLLTAIATAGEQILFVAVVLSAIGFIVRWRQSRGVERQQLKWLSTAVFFVVVVFVGIIAYGPDRMPFGVNVLFLATLVSIPITTGIAIVRHELFDIDRIISRTVSYAMVTLLLGSVFALLVVVPSVLLGSRNVPDYVIAAATLVVAALFRPVRGRVQSAVDRRFNRARYNAEHTIEVFTARLREQIDIDALGAELRDVVDRAMQPSSVSVWVRSKA